MSPVDESEHRSLTVSAEMSGLIAHVTNVHEMGQNAAEVVKTQSRHASLQTGMGVVGAVIMGAFGVAKLEGGPLAWVLAVGMSVLGLPFIIRTFAKK